MSPKDLPEQFHTKIIVADNGCWEWTASTDRYGYAKVSYKGVTQKAHRVIYELLKGKIPRKNVIDHICRNRKCVNPAHHETVTNLINVRRGAKHRRKNEKG